MTDLRTVKARARLLARGKPYFVATATPGISLGYRRLAGRAGTWTARIADGQGKNRLQAIGVADDLASGADVLTYTQAQDAARKVRQAPELDGALTVERALAEYEAANKQRLAGNTARVRYWLRTAAPELAGREVAALTADELMRWRDRIDAAPATVNRTIRILKAALTGAADRYPAQISNSNVWRIGLKQVSHPHESRNVVLNDEQVRAVVAASYEVDKAFGLFAEVAAVTGARPSQMVRLEVRDLQDGTAPRLMMPTSKKGTGSKARNIAVPITAALAAKLCSNRGPSEPLLVRTDGEAWSATSSDHARPFAKAVELAGLDKHPRKVTFYALRHSSIVRRILANRTPLRTIAAIHDTSVVMIERNYSRDIDQYDESARAGLLDLEPPAPLPGNVVKLAR